MAVSLFSLSPPSKPLPYGLLAAICLWAYTFGHIGSTLLHIGTLALLFVLLAYSPYTQPKLYLTLQDLTTDPLLLLPALPLRASRPHLIDSCHPPRGRTAGPGPPPFL